MSISNIRRMVSVTVLACTFLASAVLPIVIHRVHGQASDAAKPSPGFSVAYEENRGQYDSRVLFVGKGNGQTVFLTADEATFAMQMPSAQVMVPAAKDSIGKVPKPENRDVYALKMRFTGANLKTEKPVFAGELPGKLNYFRGNERSKWVTNVARFSRVTSRNIYQGIDLVWKSNAAGAMEYDLVVGPNADARQISLEFDGADRIWIDPAGGLALETLAGTLRHGKPVVFQEIDGTRRAVESGYVVNGNQVKFSLGDYDRTKPLVIDPILVPIYYSTFLGGTGGDVPSSIKVDASNNAYVAGNTASVNFPIISGINPGSTDAFVTKLNTNGTALIYSTLIGGSDVDAATSIAIDGNGNAYVTGSTVSSNFPTSWSTYDGSHNGSMDAFVTKLGPTGSTIPFSTYLGGLSSDVANGIALDPAGSMYVVGTTSSANFPTTIRAYDKVLAGNNDVFVTKFSTIGVSLTYSTYVGGNNNSENGAAIAVDSLGRAYITGAVEGGGFPVTAGSFSNPHNAMFRDLFVTLLNATGSSLVYSTAMGGDGFDEAYSIAIDTSGNAYVTGYTYSTNYPVTPGAYASSIGASIQAAFVTKVDATGSALAYSTYLGTGGANTIGYAIAVRSSGAILVTGNTTSNSNFPTITPCWDYTPNGAYDLFLVKLQGTAGSPLTAATLIGGAAGEIPYAIAVNSAGDAFITGQTSSSDFPTTLWTTAYDPSYNGATDGFVLRYDKQYLP